MSNSCIAAAAAMLAVAACAESPPAQPPSNVPTISQREIGPTVSRMVCEHQSVCGQIGPGQTHESVAACISETEEDIADAVDIEDCPAGASMVRVNACLDDIKNESCPVDDDVRGVAACDDTVMCIRPEEAPLLDPELRGRTRRSR